MGPRREEEGSRRRDKGVIGRKGEVGGIRDQETGVPEKTGRTLGPDGVTGVRNRGGEWLRGPGIGRGELQGSRTGKGRVRGSTIERRDFPERTEEGERNHWGRWGRGETNHGNSG